MGALKPMRLEYFMSVYRSKSYSAAAMSAYLTYQGIVRAVQSLEKDLGVKLFEIADNRKLEPTQYADMLFDLALGWTKDEQALSERMREIAGEGRVVVSMGAAIGTLGVLGTDLAEVFGRENPRYNLEIFEDTDVLVDNGLLNGEYDLALTTAPFKPEFETDKLYSSKAVVLANKDNPLSSKSSVEISDLAGQRVAGAAQQSKAIKSFVDVLDAEGVVLESFIKATNLVFVYEYCRAGKGIGIFPSHMIRYYCHDNDVVCVPINNIPDWSFGISCLKSHKLRDSEIKAMGFIKGLTDRIC